MASPNRNFSFDFQKQNQFGLPRGAAGLRRGQGSRGARGTTHGPSAFPCPEPTPGRFPRPLRKGHESRESREAIHAFPTSSDSCPDPAPITPGRSFQRGRRLSRAGIFSLALGLNRGNSSFATSSNSCPNPAPTSERSFQKGRRISRARIFSLALGLNRGNSSLRRNNSSESEQEAFNRGDCSTRKRESEHQSSTRGDSFFRRRDRGESEIGSFNRGDSSHRRTYSDESEVSDEISSSRRWVHGGFLSNISPTSSPPPPLPPRPSAPLLPLPSRPSAPPPPRPSSPPPPRQHKPEEENNSLVDKLRLALAEAHEEINGKSSQSSTDEEEDFILLDNIQKMNLEDPKNEEENTCVICMDKPKTHAYIPCGHRVVCVNCSEDLKTKGMLQCVICRKEAHGIFQIF